MNVIKNLSILIGLFVGIFAILSTIFTQDELKHMLGLDQVIEHLGEFNNDGLKSKTFRLKDNSPKLIKLAATSFSVEFREEEPPLVTLSAAGDAPKTLQAEPHSKVQFRSAKGTFELTILSVHMSKRSVSVSVVQIESKP